MKNKKQNINRRRFIKIGLIGGLAGISAINSDFLNATTLLSQDLQVDRVRLGNTNMMVSRIAMGTGTKGYNKSSNQTRAGMDSFIKIAHHAYDRGITFYDMAENYGSHTFVGEAIKDFPREKLTLLTKMWTHDNNKEPVSEKIDQYRKEIGTDYIDILFMHCMMSGDWPKTRTHYMDGLSKAKQDGIVKAVGVSCHNLEALIEASTNPWVDVIMARINPFGANMDASADEVVKILATAKNNGKGIIGMKIFGEGKHVKDEEREESIKFGFTKGNIHCMTLGMESIQHIDDAIERVMRL
jgi:aryl-alcohol dehydrogenase-like predicted oxidoreductase